MLARMAAALLVVLAGAAAPAQAYEALALKVLGFSPDGRYFGFIQYGGQGDGSQRLAESYVLDVATSRVVPGAPARIDTLEDESLLPQAQDDDTLLALARTRSQSMVERYKITESGTVVTRVKTADPEHTHAGSGGPTGGAMSMAVRHRRLGKFKLALAIENMPWPAASKVANGAGALPCTEEAGATGAAFRLTLTQGRRRIVLNDDTTVPAERFCVSGYGIAEVLAFDRPDGKVSLAVILDMQTRGFEGDDRKFLAVTAILGR